MTTQTSAHLDLHGKRAALRGNPSFVWRAGQNRRLEMILRWGHSNNAPDLGDVLVDGCGVGMYVKALLPYAKTVCGIDIEAEHLEVAAQTAPQAYLQLAAAEMLPYPANRFDLVLSHEVLEHVQDDHAAVAELVRVLKPGGRALLFVPNRLYPFE
ncbi:MAG: class I SAM-dependent methyltransferase, partial [Chloroflexi bacterium]